MFDKFTNKERKYLKLIGYPSKVRKTSELEKPTRTHNHTTASKGTILGHELTGDSWWYNARGNWGNEEELTLDSKKVVY